MSREAIDRATFEAIYDQANMLVVRQAYRPLGVTTVEGRMKRILHTVYGVPYMALNTMLRLVAIGVYPQGRVITYSGDFLVDYAGNNITNYGS